MQQLVRFTLDAAGLERILRLAQALAQILLAAPLLAAPLTALLNKHVVARPLRPKDALQIASALRGKLGLVRRTIRLFWFLGSFQAATTLLVNADGSAVGVTRFLDLAGRTFNGLYLVLESATLLDAAGVAGLSVFGARAGKINVEAQRFWFLALGCGIVSGVVRIAGTFGGGEGGEKRERITTAKKEVVEGKQGSSRKEGKGGEKEAERKKRKKDEKREERKEERKEEKREDLNNEEKKVKRERKVARRGPLVRKLVSDVLDIAAPGVIVGWIKVDALWVSVAMVGSTFLTGWEIWKKCA